MSEFSESFHLRSDDTDLALGLLRRARAPGYVFPAERGFVSFVCPSAAAPEVVKRNVELLVHYSFAADHGCWVKVYRGPKQVAQLSVDFEAAEASFERSKFVALGLLDEPGAQRVSNWIKQHEDMMLEREHRHDIARALALPRFAWLSYEYQKTEDAPPDGRLELDAKGKTRTFEQTLDDDLEELLESLPPPAPSEPSTKQAAKSTQKRAGATPTGSASKKRSATKAAKKTGTKKKAAAPKTAKKAKRK